MGNKFEVPEYYLDDFDNWIVDSIETEEIESGAKIGDLCIYDEQSILSIWCNETYVGMAVDESTDGKYYYFRKKEKTNENVS